MVEPGEEGDEDESENRCVYYSENNHTVTTEAVHAFFSKKHRFIFWPLAMFQAQVMSWHVCMVARYLSYTTNGKYFCIL